MIKAAFFEDPDQEHLLSRVKIALSIAAVVYYFFLIFAAQLKAATEKQFLKRSITAGIFNLHYSLLVLIISWTAIYSGASLLSYVVQNEQSFLLPFLTTLLFTIIVVISRLFCIKIEQILSSTKERQA